MPKVVRTRIAGLVPADVEMTIGLALAGAIVAGFALCAVPALLAG
jgi:hypothetical protein